MMPRRRTKKLPFTVLLTDACALVAAIRKDVDDGWHIVCEAIPMTSATVH